MGNENARRCRDSVDWNIEILKRRVAKNYLDEIVGSLDEAIEGEKVRRRKRNLIHSAWSATLQIASRKHMKGFMPDVVTEMCPCHDPVSLYTLRLLA